MRSKGQPNEKPAGAGFQHRPVGVDDGRYAIGVDATCSPRHTALERSEQWKPRSPSEKLRPLLLHALIHPSSLIAAVEIAIRLAARIRRAIVTAVRNQGRSAAIIRAARRRLAIGRAAVVV